MVTDKLGKILWELNSYFVPYRSEFVPPSFWDPYFVKD
jgi:arylsulfate sulfotransferase